MKTKFKVIKRDENLAEFECQFCGTLIFVQQNTDNLKFPDKCNCEWE